MPAAGLGVVAVTGGTGFIGRHLVAALLRARRRVRVLARRRGGMSDSDKVTDIQYPVSVGTGSTVAPGTVDIGRHTSDFTHRTLDTGHEMSAVGHQTSDVEHKTSDAEHQTSDADPRPDIIWGDLRDPAAVTRLLEGAEVVFHLAAYARAWAADPRVYHEVNVQGTRHVVAAARACGVRRVVHVSTELVHGDGPDRTAYQRSKREAERVIEDYVATGGDAVIARPTRVYGPGPLNQANSVTRVIALYRRGRFRARLADGNARANYVYVSDVVDGLLRAAERGRPGAAYLLGGENLSLVQLLQLASEAAGRRYGVMAVPLPLAHAVALAFELLAPLGIDPLITREWVDLLARDRPASSELPEAELAYRPRSAREGVAATVAWLAAGGPPYVSSEYPQWQPA